MRYLNNPLTSAIVIGGLEPFEQSTELFRFIFMLRRVFGCNDDVVIYTGYTEDEIKDDVKNLSAYENIIIKFGRYRPDQEAHYDDVLGVNLVSDNQYAIRIS